jgi:hypothetical protein
VKGVDKKLIVIKGIRSNHAAILGRMIALLHKIG